VWITELRLFGASFVDILYIIILIVIAFHGITDPNNIIIVIVIAFHGITDPNNIIIVIVILSRETLFHLLIYLYN